MIELYNIDNMEFETNKKAQFIYADMIYENLDLRWITKYWFMLNDTGIMAVQTDWHSLIEVGIWFKQILGAELLNHIVWKNEFGNFPKNKFRQSHDDILIFVKDVGNYKFYPDRVQVEKATAKSKGLNPSGRTTKLATSVWTDICLTTVSKERIKKEDGKSIRWQKPLALMDRLLSPFTDNGDLVIDVFMGSGTLGEWCRDNNRDYIGLELNENVFSLAKKRILN